MASSLLSLFDRENVDEGNQKDGRSSSSDDSIPTPSSAASSSSSSSSGDRVYAPLGRDGLVQIDANGDTAVSVDNFETDHEDEAGISGLGGRVRSKSQSQSNKDKNKKQNSEENQQHYHHGHPPLELRNPVFEEDGDDKFHPTYTFQNTAVGSYREQLGEYAAGLGMSHKTDEKDGKKKANFLVRAVKHRSHVLVFLTILGVLIGCMSVALEIGVQYLHELHVYLGQITSIWVLDFLIWIAFQMAVVFLILMAVLHIAPTAAGSGLPEMKVMLSGVVIHQYLSFRTFLVKILGLTAGLGSGLLIGKDGPFAHTSASLADNLMKIPYVFERIRLNDALRQQVLCAAMAAGVAATFGSPIGGVLYSIEVTSTYFPFRNYWLSGYTGFISALVFRLVNASRLGKPLFAAVVQVNYNTVEVLAEMDGFDLFMGFAIGVFGGLLGALYIKSHMMIVYIRRLGIKTGFYLLKTPYLYAFVVCLLTAIVIFPDLVGDFMPLRGGAALAALFSPGPLVYPRVLQHDWQKNNLYWNLVTFFLSRYILSVLTISIPIPCGFLLPTFGAGGAMGRIFGEWVTDGFDTHAYIPSLYALMGSAALAAGITHNYSTVIILLELTGQMIPSLPLLVAMITAITISKKIGYNLFDGIIISRKLPFLPDIRRDKSLFLTAIDLIEHDFLVNDLYLTQRMSHIDLTRIANDERYTHDHFAVVKLVDGEPFLRGVVSRGVLKRLLDAAGNPFGDDDDENSDGSRSSHEGEETWQKRVSSVIKKASLSLHRSQKPDLKEFLAHDENDMINVPFQPPTVELQPSSTMMNIHQLFIILRLRSAFVTDHGRLLGIVTRDKLRVHLTPKLYFWELDPTTL